MRKLSALLLIFSLLFLSNSWANNQQSDSKHPSISTNELIQQKINPPSVESASLISVLKKLNKEKGLFFLFTDSSISNLIVALPNMAKNVDEIVNDITENSGLEFKKVSENTFAIKSNKSNAINTNAIDEINITNQNLLNTITYFFCKCNESNII